VTPGAADAAFGESFRLTLLTTDPELAEEADIVGVHQIGVDLERLGKRDRQQSSHARISDHSVEDLANVVGRLSRAKAFVRVNPLNPALPAEIDAVVAAGAKAIMLPFFEGPREVAKFVSLVAGRADALILVETAPALARIREILAVGGIAEMTIGLTDLHQSLGLANRFELLASPLLEMAADEARKAGIVFSVGGLGRPDQAYLPVPADLVIAQYPRIGATGAWLSRSFFEAWPEGRTLAEELGVLRRRLTEWSVAGAEKMEDARLSLAALVGQGTA
jgi:GNAT superfamily N-acetyltransferase